MQTPLHLFPAVFPSWKEFLEVAISQDLFCLLEGVPEAFQNSLRKAEQTLTDAEGCHLSGSVPLA